ncbi:hypothetical protein PSTG_18411, partial [Puccinia striiformis f. sp. tritici PST-78]
MRLDRDWYNHEEGNALDDEFNNPFASYEAESAATEPTNEKGKKRMTANQAARHEEQQLWEEQQLRMSSTGNTNRRKLDLDFTDEEESRVHLLIHDLKPPFLDGRLIFTKQLDPVNVPTRPASQRFNRRQRPDDTPSHGPGLTSTAQAKLDEHRKKRAAQVTQEQFDSRNAKPNSEGALKEFRERANRSNKFGPPRSHEQNPPRGRHHESTGTISSRVPSSITDTPSSGRGSSQIIKGK